MNRFVDSNQSGFALAAVFVSAFPVFRPERPEDDTGEQNDHPHHPAGAERFRYGREVHGSFSRRCDYGQVLGEFTIN